MKLYEIRNRDPRSMPGYGDPETFPPQTRSDGVARGTGGLSKSAAADQAQSLDDFNQSRGQQAQRDYQASYDEQIEKREGQTEDGQRYNTILYIKAQDDQTADARVYKYADLNHGAKEIVGVEKDGTNRIVYVKDNHAKGHFRPFDD